jgi:hypothetical protein
VTNPATPGTGLQEVDLGIADTKPTHGRAEFGETTRSAPNSASRSTVTTVTWLIPAAPMSRLYFGLGSRAHGLPRALRPQSA